MMAEKRAVAAKLPAEIPATIGAGVGFFPGGNCSRSSAVRSRADAGASFRGNGRRTEATLDSGVRRTLSDGCSEGSPGNAIGAWVDVIGTARFARMKLGVRFSLNFSIHFSRNGFE